MIDLARALAISFGSIGLAYFGIRWVYYMLYLRSKRKHTLTTWAGILGQRNPDERRDRSWFSRIVHSAEEGIDRSIRSLNTVSRAASQAATSTQDVADVMRSANLRGTQTGRLRSATGGLMHSDDAPYPERFVRDTVRMFMRNNEDEYHEGRTDILFSTDLDYDIRSCDYVIRLEGHHRGMNLESGGRLFPYAVRINACRIEGVTAHVAVEYVLQQLVEAERIVTAFARPSQKTSVPESTNKEIKISPQNLHGHAIALQRYAQKNKQCSAKNDCNDSA